MSYYGVFDGHAGARAAMYCADQLHTNVAAGFPKGKYAPWPGDEFLELLCP